MKNKNNVNNEHVASIQSANYFAVLILVLVSVLTILIVTSWEINWTKEYLIDNIININSVIAFVVLFLSIIVHECIHAILFKLFLKGEKDSVIISFNKLTLTPYCHCKEKVKLWQYGVAVIAPTIILGVIPYVLAIYFKNIIWLFFGLISFSSGGGDILILLKIIQYGKYNVWVKDHPEKVGFVVCESE